MDVFSFLSNLSAYWVLFSVVRFFWKRWDSVLLAISTLSRDLTWVKVLYFQMLPYWLIRKVRNETVHKSLDKLVLKHPEKVCFYFEDEEWTYIHVQMMSYQVANYFQEKGYRKGDVVALAMMNRPEMACIWLGLSRIGVITTLINYNLRDDSLHQCLSVAKCKGIIIGSEMKGAMEEIWDEKDTTPVYELDRYNIVEIKEKSNLLEHGIQSSLKTTDLAKCLQETSTKPVTVLPNEEPQFTDNIFYVFTSGTTGLPKQAKLTHSRFINFAAISKIVRFTSKDKVYCCVPMYHMLANFGVVWAFVNGCPLVITRKFSASRFWDDVCKYDCTVSLYIGEICRFLLKQGKNKMEQKHKLRIALNVGTKPEVWIKFVERFGIRKIVELYGATEGNCTMMNIEGTKVGAVGYIPIWMQPIYPTQLVKVDPITGVICRDEKTGFAIKCGVDEEGEMVGKIFGFLPSGKFDGYTNEAATEGKIVRDLFRKGDKYFRSGDSLCKDSQGYFYFKDRMGDTFRRNGENVATAEVENAVLRLTGMRNNVVYGVTIPGIEGSFGMLAISDADGGLDVAELQLGMEQTLAKYARPLFIRCVQDPNAFKMTGTYKLQKLHWVSEGFNLEEVTDPIYVFCFDSNAYRKLDTGIYREILSGNFRM